MFYKSTQWVIQLFQSGVTQNFRYIVKGHKKHDELLNSYSEITWPRVKMLSRETRDT